MSDCLRSDEGLRAWTSGGFAIIRNKAKELVPLEPSRLQRDIFDCVQFCLKERVPCRILSLKRRQGHGSTGAMTAMHWSLRRAFGEGTVIADIYKRTDNLLQMVRTFAANDLAPWGDDGNLTLGQREIRYPNGSILRHDTAEDPHASRSYTYTHIIATELARWTEKGVAPATDIMVGLLGSQPKLPGTLTILDTTALGPTGYFYETWQDAVDWEDIRDGRVKAMGQWIRIFCPAYYNYDSCIHGLTPEQQREIERSMDEEERLLKAQYNLPIGVIEFRRRTIRDECKKRRDIFRREYPFTPEEAFSASSPSIFNPDALIYLEGEARMAKRDVGILDNANGDGRTYTFVPTDEERAYFWVWERPTIGYSYLASIDVMSGEANDETCDDRDRHAMGIWRKGFYDLSGKWHPTKLVARTKAPIQWPIPELARRAMELLRWYGNPLCVPEANNHGLTLIHYLRDAGARLYERKTGDSKLNVRQSKSSGQFGVLTTGGKEAEGSKIYMVTRMEHMIREWDQPDDGVEIHCLHMLGECRTFIQDDDGKYLAMSGKHDDDISMGMIGLSFIDQATELKTDTQTMRRRLTDPILREELELARRQRRISALKGFS